jgi:uncharacterized protein with PQ loop repeat
MSHPNHHFGIHKHLTKKQKRKTIDMMAYVVGIGGNIAVVPQIVLAWSSDAPGLAIATWTMFSGIGIIWLVYAILHKQKPLIVAQITGLSCNLLVVAGWVINNVIR